MTLADPEAILGKTVLGADGSKVGKVEDVFLDDDTRRPEWAAVKTGLFGHKVAFVPLATAEDTATSIRIPYDRALVKGAPHVGVREQLSVDEEEQLFRHYGIAFVGESVTAHVGGVSPSGDQVTDRAAGNAMPREVDARQ
jgi:sporulation protein YlmC with PRC-barrel domain